MPMYAFENPETGEQFEFLLTHEQLVEFEKDFPHLNRIFKMNLVGGQSASGFKNDDGWKENLARIAENHPGSKLATDHKKDSIKDAKTKKVLEKHRKISAQKAKKKK